MAVLENGVAQLMELGDVNSTDSFQRIKIHNKVSVNVGVSIDSGLMDLSLSINEFSLEDLLAIIGSYKNKKNIIACVMVTLSILLIRLLKN